MASHGRSTFSQFQRVQALLDHGAYGKAATVAERMESAYDWSLSLEMACRIMRNMDVAHDLVEGTLNGWLKQGSNIHRPNGFQSSPVQPDACSPKERGQQQ